MIFGSRALLPVQGRAGLRALHDDRIAAGAAEAAARETQEPQFLLVRGEHETLAAASMLPTAWGDRTPLVVITQVPRYAEARIGAVLDVVTRRRVQAQPNESAEQTLHRLLPLSWRDVPVHVSLPFELPAEAIVSAAAKCDVALHDDRSSASPVPGVGALSWIAAELMGARRPAVLLGREGLRDCDLDAVLDLADAVDAPVLLTAGATALTAGLSAKWSAFERRDSVVVNPSLVWDLTMRRSDILLALGARLAEADLFGLHDLRWFRGRCIVISTLKVGVPEGAARWVPCAPNAIIAPLREAMRRHHPRQPRRRWRARVERRRSALRRIAVDEARRARTPAEIDPAWAAWRIGTSAPPNTRFIAEGNISGLWIRAFTEIDQVITPIHMGTIGVAIPWMVGIAAARPEARIWAGVGDGAFLFQPAALPDLKTIGAAAAVFVFNDASWNSIRMAQTMMFSARHVGTDLPPANHADLAAALGCEGYVATTPAELDAALQHVLDPARTRPVLVDVRLRAGSVPWLGLGFALAEVDYMLRPMAWRIVVSAARAVVRGQVPWRSLRVFLRVAFA